MVATALAQHDQVKMFGELFNISSIVRNPREYASDSFIDSLLQQSFPETCVGFKLMYGQLTNRELVKSYWGENLPTRIEHAIEQITNFQNEHGTIPFQQLEDKLFADKSTKVIHLVRENQLASFVSFQLALREDNWIGKPFQHQAPLAVDVEHLESWFEDGVRYRRYYENRCSKHSVHQVTYEQLTTDFPSELDRICEFLGIGPLQSRKPVIPKQQVQPIRDMVSNYDEVKTHFSSGPWARWFAKLE